MEANTRLAGRDTSIKNDVQTPFAASLGGNALILPYVSNPTLAACSLYVLLCGPYPIRREE